MDEEEEYELYYPHVAAFVSDRLVHLYARRVGQQFLWCPRWFEHAEALSRLDAIWRAWEHLRLDAATGISVWWRDHADPHMMALLDPDGVFSACRNGRHADAQFGLQPLPVDEPPRGLFVDQRDL